MSKRLLGGMVAAALLIVLAGCYVPNNFKAEIRLGRTGDFGLAYYGELIWAPLFREIRQGHLPPAEIADKIAAIRRDLARDSNFKSVDSLGDGRFKVEYQRFGHLKDSDLVTFVRRNAIIIEIRSTPDGRVIINGNTIKPSDAQAATTMGLDVEGEFRIITDGLVTENNATMVKPFGHYLLYIWKIQNAFSPAPHFVMQREGAWPSKP